MTAPTDLSALQDVMALRFVAGADLDVDALRVAARGKEHQASSAFTDLFNDFSADEVCDMIAEKLGQGPSGFMYLKVPMDAGLVYVFLSQHGVGDDECGSLMLELATLLSIPDVMAACSAIEISVS